MSFLGILGEHMIDGVCQWREFSFIDQFELFYEINKVLETRIEMRLGIELYDLLYVMVVHMPIDSEQPLQNGLDDLTEVFWKRHSIFDGENTRVVDLHISIFPHFGFTQIHSKFIANSMEKIWHRYYALNSMEKLQRRNHSLNSSQKSMGKI